MKNTRKVLLASTALAVAAIGNPALAQVGNIGSTGTVAVDNGGNTCADGVTTGGYITDPAPADGNIGFDHTDSTICTNQTVTETFNDAAGSFTFPGVVDGTGEVDLITQDDSGSASASYNQARESTSHFDTSVDPAVEVAPDTETVTPISGTNVANYSYTNSVETLQDTLYEFTGNYSGTGSTGIGAETEFLVTPQSHYFESTTGNSSFDPGTGDVFYTPTDGQITELDINGLSFTTLDSVNGNETITYDADGISNGTSYVDVNPDSVVIHGGTESTNILVNDAGITVTDTGVGGFGTTFTLGNTGDGRFYGNLAVDGQTSTNGIDNTGNITNTGNIQTATLQVDGASNFDGLMTSNGIDNTGQIETDTLQVNGAANFDAQITTNGIDNTGAITTDTLDVDGAANVDGTLTVGGAVIANGGVNTATIWNGTQNTGPGVTLADSMTVTGATTLQSTLAVTGTSTFTGQITTNGGIDMGTGSITDSSGAVTVADDLSVTGQINAGNATGANNTIGGTLATSSRLAAGTSYVQVNQDNVTIHGGTTSTNVVVSDAGVNISSTPGGGNLTIASDGSISSGNTGLNSGAVTINDGLFVKAGTATAGTGGITTGTVTINTTGNNKISGLADATLSATSTDAVTGRQLNATNVALQALDAREAAHYSQLMDRADKAYQGVAMNFALNAAPLSLDNGEGGISGGVGYFQGEWAGAVKAQYVSDSGIGVGVNVGFSEDAVGGGVGASIKF